MPTPSHTLDKAAIKRFAVWARRELIARVSQKALQFGIAAGAAEPADATSINGKVLSTAEVQQRFAMGDAVILQPDGTHAIVFQPADDKGMVIVQIKREKQAVNHKRLQLHIPASQLYPPDYDFSILFDTVANRKAAHVLSKRYDESATVIHKEGRSTH